MKHTGRPRKLLEAILASPKPLFRSFFFSDPHIEPTKKEAFEHTARLFEVRSGALEPALRELLQYISGRPPKAWILHIAYTGT